MRFFTSLNNEPWVAVEQVGGVPPGGVGMGEPESLLLQERFTRRQKNIVVMAYLFGFIFQSLRKNDETRTLVG
jgi:hypothetical protein